MPKNLRIFLIKGAFYASHAQNGSVERPNLERSLMHDPINDDEGEKID